MRSSSENHSSDYGAYYGIYRKCRDAAWRCHLEFSSKSLPVDVRAIARIAGVRVVRNSVILELRPSEYGISICDGSNWTIIYDDRLPGEQSRAVVAHELGHIFLGHDYRLASRRFQQRRCLEKEADAFASRLLMPACLLHELNVRTPSEIVSLCHVPLELARCRAKRMLTLEKRHMFYTSPLELAVLMNYLPWLRAQSGGRPLASECGPPREAYESSVNKN